MWGRQVNNLWECYWAWGKDATEAFRNLAARKGLRDFSSIEELGDRCIICGEREALWDGKQPGETSRTAVLRFWNRLLPLKLHQDKDYYKVPEGLIRPEGKERLCTICLIKRLIPWEKTNPIRKLWKATDMVFPSTSTMATVLYRSELVNKACENKLLKDAMKSFLETLDSYGKMADPLGSFQCWQESWEQANSIGWSKAEALLRLDGDWYLYGESVKKELSLSEKDDEKIRGSLKHTIKVSGLPSPPIYWALLTMDGDRMGKLKGVTENAWAGKIISETINKFAMAVPPIVKKHNGRLVYAGGDDVLALFPVETALDAAEELRNKFYDIFNTAIETHGLTLPKEGPPTLSGSLIYAHHQAPLGRLIQSGHVLLTLWAKGKAGRNALAVQVYKRGGPALTFARQWEEGKDKPENTLVARIQDVVKLLTDKETSAGFLYNLRQEKELFDSKGPFGSNKDMKKLYIASLVRKTRLREGKADSEEEKTKKAVEVSEKIFSLCQHPSELTFDTDPLIFARFLKTGGREE